MTTVAVTGASGPLGQAVLGRLERDGVANALIAVDVEPPALPSPLLAYRPVDLRDRLLPLALDGVDVVVHCGAAGAVGEPEDRAFAGTVGATRNLLEAVAKVGAAKLVVVSSASVYGAHADAAVPFDESAPLRANADLPPAYQQQLAEELVWDWADAHEATTVTVLRPVTVLGPGIDTLWTRLLEAPRLLRARGAKPVAQVVALEDLADAIALAVAKPLPGAFNVAADGWLSADEVASALGKRTLELGETALYELHRWLWARRVGMAQPGLVHYLTHAGVVRTARLRAHGWAPAHSHREVLRAFAAERSDRLALGRFRLSRRRLRRAGLLALIVGALLGVRAAGWLLHRHRPGAW